MLQPTVSRSACPAVRGHHPGPATNLSFSPRKLSPDICGFLLWGILSDEWRGLSFTHTSATSPYEPCHSNVQVPQYLRSYLIVSFQTGFLFSSSSRYKSLGTYCTEDTVPSSSSTVVSRENCLNLAENTIPLLPLYGHYRRTVVVYITFTWSV
jgi:hypothetical protein